MFITPTFYTFTLIWAIAKWVISDFWHQKSRKRKNANKNYPEKIFPDKAFYFFIVHFCESQQSLQQSLHLQLSQQHFLATTHGHAWQHSLFGDAINAPIKNAQITHTAITKFFIRYFLQSKVYKSNSYVETQRKIH